MPTKGRAGVTGQNRHPHAYMDSWIGNQTKGIYIHIYTYIYILIFSTVSADVMELRGHRTSTSKVLNNILTQIRPEDALINHWYYNDVIMSAMASQITSFTTVYSAVQSGADQRKHQSSTPLAPVRGIHRWPVNSPHKRPAVRKMFPFDDVIVSISHHGIGVT